MEPEWKEADIVISGKRLTFSQAMTIRVALQTFAMGLAEDGLGDDGHGKAMTDSYLRDVSAINKLLAKTAR